MLALQRGAGNRAVGGALTRGQPGDLVPSAGGRAGGTIKLALDRPHPVSTFLGRSDVRARMPTFADLRTVYTDKTLNISEAVIKDRITRILSRMRAERRLKSNDPVPDIVNKIFPGPGRIDQTAFNDALDVADRTVIYQSALDASTKVKASDQTRLVTAMGDAGALIAAAEGDAAGLRAIFGAKAPIAQARYAAARKALADAAAHLSTRVSTDYNLDDPEVNLGGWASYGPPRHMHLLVDIVKVTDPAETKITLIHEAAHLGSLTVHEQNPSRARITPLDLTTTEGIARGFGIVGSLIKRQSIPPGPLTDQGTANLLVETAMAAYGQLLTDPGRDKALLDWLVAHYRKVP